MVYFVHTNETEKRNITIYFSQKYFLQKNHSKHERSLKHKRALKNQRILRYKRISKYQRTTKYKRLLKHKRYISESYTKDFIRTTKDNLRMKSQYKYANDSGQFLYEGLSFIFNHHHIKHINNIAPCQKTSRELPFGHKDYLFIICFYLYRILICSLRCFRNQLSEMLHLQDHHRYLPEQITPELS